MSSETQSLRSPTRSAFGFLRDRIFRRNTDLQLERNRWFEAEVAPYLRQRVSLLLGR